MRNLNIVLMVLMVGCSMLCAQNKQLLYDFKEVPQAVMVNPGMQTSYQWYAGIPGLSGISLQAGTSSISVNDLFADDGLDFTTKVRERVVFGIGKNDDLSGTFQIDLLNVGFRAKHRPDTFYSMGMYLEGDAIGYWFKDLAILGFEGNADYLGKKFDLEHLKTRGELVNVFHFGVNRKIDNELTVGVRAKLYSSIFNYSSTHNKGYFLTTEGQNNLLASTLNADMELRTSGVNVIKDILDEDIDDVEKKSKLSNVLLKRSLLGGDLGVGFDAGFSYNLSEQTVITGSILDLGFIYNTTDVTNFTLKGNATVEGVEIILPEALADPNADFWQDLVDEIEELVPFESNHKNYITFRPTKLYGSIRYNFGKPVGSQLDCDCNPLIPRRRRNIDYANSIGGQLYVINRPRGPQAAVTAFYQRKFGNSMALKTTYTVDRYTFSNVGLGVSIQAGPINLYAMADNLLSYSNLADSRYASFQFGLNIISWGKK